MIARERQAAVDAYIAEQELKRKEAAEEIKISKKAFDKALQDRQEAEQKNKLL